MKFLRTSQMILIFLFPTLIHCAQQNKKVIAEFCQRIANEYQLFDRTTLVFSESFKTETPTVVTAMKTLTNAELYPLLTWQIFTISSIVDHLAHRAPEKGSAERSTLITLLRQAAHQNVFYPWGCGIEGDKEIGFAKVLSGKELSQEEDNESLFSLGVRHCAGKFIGEVIRTIPSIYLHTRVDENKDTFIMQVIKSSDTNLVRVMGALLLERISKQDYRQTDKQGLDLLEIAHAKSSTSDSHKRLYDLLLLHRCEKYRTHCNKNPLTYYNGFDYDLDLEKDETIGNLLNKERTKHAQTLQEKTNAQRLQKLKQQVATEIIRSGNTWEAFVQDIRKTNKQPS